MMFEIDLMPLQVVISPFGFFLRSNFWTMWRAWCSNYCLVYVATWSKNWPNKPLGALVEIELLLWQLLISHFMKFNIIILIDFCLLISGAGGAWLAHRQHTAPRKSTHTLVVYLCEKKCVLIFSYSLKSITYGFYL